MANFFEWLKVEKGISIKKAAKMMKLPNPDPLYRISNKRATKITDTLLNKIRTTFYDEGNEYIAHHQPQDSDYINTQLLNINEGLVNHTIKLTNQLTKALNVIDTIKISNRSLKSEISDLLETIEKLKKEIINLKDKLR